ncbi:hypothetical protein FRC03_009044 [Tulasnella sp. 419]|nr:hypothetical protein FRC03_009044 [Tulasnella sp. 419]
MHQPLTDAEECNNSTCNTETHLKDQTVRPRHLIKSQFESLPQELIVEIFKYCRENAVSEEHSPKAVKLREMIQNLRQVCFRWNHIMENTPAMWSYIIIGNGRQEVLPPFLAWTRRSVSLSKNTTLYIEVDYPNSTLESHGEIMEAIRDVLLPEIHRWGACRLYYDPAYIKPHLELFKKPAPRLEVFEASADQDHLSKIVHITNLFDNHAPRLHNLFIPTLAISWNSPLLINLTYLCIFAKDGEGTPMEDQYHRILTSNPQLEYLRIEGENGVFMEPGLDFQFDVLMPKLGMLNLEFLPHRTCRSILSSIRSEAWCDIGLRCLSGNPFA